MITVAAVLVLLLVLMAIGVEIFIALGISGVVGIVLFRGFDAVPLAATAFLSQATTIELLALPLFVLMGSILSRTPIGSDLYVVGTRWLSWLPGGLAIGSIGACTTFGAVSGVSVAGVAAIGSTAVPEMLKHGYSSKIAAGSVVASGALAMLIPPSVPFIIYSAITGESIPKLFIGGLVPGLLLALLFSIYVYVRVTISPHLAPSSSVTYTWRERWESLGRVWHAGLLIIIVLGSIYSGIATPTEASGLGAAGAMLIALLAYGNRTTLSDAIAILTSSLRITVALMAIICCAAIFANFMSMARIPDTLVSFVMGLEVPDVVIFMVMQLLLLAIGMFVDAASLLVIVTPILVPIIIAMGYDPIWFGIILVLNLELAVITPPVGLNLYTLKTVVPSLSLQEIIRSTLPFLLIELIVLVIFTAFPELSLWLPNLVN